MKEKNNLESQSEDTTMTDLSEMSLDLSLNLNEDPNKEVNKSTAAREIESRAKYDAHALFEPMTSGVPELPEQQREKPVEMYYEREIMVEGDIQNAPVWKVILAFIKAMFPGLFRPFILIVSIVGMVFGFFLLVVSLAAVILFQFAGVHTAVVMGSIGMAVYGQSVAWLIWGEFENFILMSFVPTQWLIFGVLWLLPIILVILGMISLKQ